MDAGNGHIIGQEAVSTIQDFIADQSTEGTAFYNPLTFNAFAGADQWATITVANAYGSDRTTPANTVTAGPFNMPQSPWQPYFNVGETEITVEIDHTAEPLKYHAVVGVQWTNSGWRAERVKIEAFDGTIWTTGLDTTTNGATTAAAKFSLGAAGVQKTKFTFGNPANSAGGYMRICQFFGYDYNGVSSYDSEKSGTYYIERFRNSAHYSNIYPAIDSDVALGQSGKRYTNVYSDALDVAGNITVTGTVDGKDVSTLIANVVEDTSPQLGASLDGQGFDLTNAGQMWLDATLEDKISLYDNRLGATNMYGFGVESGTLYHKSVTNHRWYINTNADVGASDYMNLNTSGLWVAGNVECSGITTDGGIRINMGTPNIFLDETDGGTDQNVWRFRSASGQFQFHIGDDAEANFTKVMHVDRSGTGAGVAVDQILFNADVHIQDSAGNEILTLQDSGGAGTAADPYIAFRDSASTRIGYVGVGSGSTNDMYLLSDAGNIQITAGGGTIEMNDLVDMNNNNINDANRVYADALYLNETSAAQSDVTGDGQFWVKSDAPNHPMFTGDTGIDYDLGLGQYKRISATSLDNTNTNGETIGRQHINGIWIKTDTSTDTLTLEESSGTNFPVGSQLSIVNAGTSGNMTVSDTTTQTLYVLDGSSVTDVAGSCTIAPGGYATLIRFNTSTSYIMGAGVTA
jgi:hypothetical protein